MIDSHRPRKSTTQAEAILRVSYRRRVEQRSKSLFAIFRLCRDDRQQRSIDVRHAGDILEWEWRLDCHDACSRQRLAPRGRVATGKLIDRVDPQNSIVADCAPHAAYPL